MIVPEGASKCTACGGTPELQCSRLSEYYSIHCTTCNRCTLEYPTLSAAIQVWNVMNGKKATEYKIMAPIGISKAEPYCAQWMRNSSGDWFCSNCKRRALWDNDRTVDPELPFGFTIVKSPYCPHCGMSMAKSKGGESDGQG